MNVALCPVTPATSRPLSETDTGFTRTEATPVAATPVTAAAFVAGIALGVAVCQAIGSQEPVIQ
ncbi:hypothetical protein CP967_02445 [Streptomyces nitrosporeus]|uniref:Uncharacterized protein n=1 Tax=Streptomyces nitrosporeus TaxID=28894 RepID=A0A5J6F4N4_9ACTN|nr:hypothetical protein [Streptomyces nitrosporeus]QEU70966.1 hypothetical protein CP967_02445 [Streptomyces nitrosporeus]GGZ23020.1 hypothetical protein GCM10010327_62420 [Streptomyces nitrosporeus]